MTQVRSEAAAQNFLNFVKGCILPYILQFGNKKCWVTQLVFELYTLKAKIKGVFNRLYCCYGNLLYQKDDRSLFTNDWEFVSYKLL